MGLREMQPESGQVGADEDEKHRLPLFHLVGMAAGGVVGSGWLLAPVSTYDKAGPYAYVSWLFGGFVILVIAGVMVELGTAAPKTGGLIFLPLQSSGALAATVVAAGLWIFYAINLASEAVAMAKGLSWKVSGILTPGDTDTLTLKGWGYVLAFMVVISAVNLVAPRIFFRINSWLTVMKVAIPILVIVLLIVSGFSHEDLATTNPETEHDYSFGAALAAVIGSGVIYSYVGFQGPLDLAGNVRRRGIGEAARLRWAVFGTIIGSIVLYTMLAVVFTRFHTHYTPANPESPYTQFAFAASLWWFGWLLRIDVVASPMGAGLVFTHALTREVAALSRAHLTHRGLQAARKAALKQRYDVYWLVLLVDFFIALIILVAVGGNWEAIVAISGVLTLVVYAFPGVVLVSLRDRFTGFTARRLAVHGFLARVGFVLIALILYAAGWASLWKGMATLAVGCTVLFGLPVLSQRLPALGRMYDAKEYVPLFRQWHNPTARTAVGLIGFLATLTLLTLMGNYSAAFRAQHRSVWAFFGCVVVIAALVAFEYLVLMSRRHMVETPPVLPAPASSSNEASG